MRTPKFWESRIHFEEAARTHRVLAELPAQAQGRLSLEYRFLHADGRYHWLKDDLRLIRNAEGLPLEIEGHWLDVTDRRRLEESLSDEAARYHKLAETVGEIVWTRDAEGHTIAISPNAREILGFEPGELLNMRRRLWWKRIQPEDAVRVRAAFQGLILDGRPYTVDYRIKRSDESWLEVREKGIVRRKNDGLVLADGTVVELIRDRESAIADFIDERRRLEGLLQRSEERFRLLVDNMPSGVAVYEPRDDGRDFIIKDFNRAAGLARAIAGELGLPRDKVEEIHIGGRLHDIGMISLPLKILSKPGKVTDIEFERLKTHTKLGADIVRKADFSPAIVDMVLHHHERLDGTGYPDGLKREEIGLEAMCLAVADVVEAMSSDRPHRPAAGIDKALEEIERNKGVLYDERVADTCLTIFREKGFKLG